MAELLCAFQARYLLHSLGSEPSILTRWAASDALAVAVMCDNLRGFCTRERVLVPVRARTARTDLWHPNCTVAIWLKVQLGLMRSRRRFFLQCLLIPARTTTFRRSLFFGAHNPRNFLLTDLI